MVGLGVSATAEAATSDPLRVTGAFEGRAFAAGFGDLSLSRPAGATRATLTGTLKGAGLPAAGMRFAATADVTGMTIQPPKPTNLEPLPPVMKCPGLPDAHPPIVCLPIETVPPFNPMSKAFAVDPVPVIPPIVVPPVAQIPGICTVLQLDVQNLHLDLLGLVVLIPDPGLHLIVGGAPRDGALLGNLLCNLAGARASARRPPR